MCNFFAWALILIARVVLPVLVAISVTLFGNWTVGPYQVYFKFVINYMSLLCQ